jgi:hypothetical protein
VTLNKATVVEVMGAPIWVPSKEMSTPLQGGMSSQKAWIVAFVETRI